MSTKRELTLKGGGGGGGKGLIQDFLGEDVPLNPATLETLIRCTCSSAEFCHPVIKLPKSLPILESFFLETTIILMLSFLLNYFAHKFEFADFIFFYL